MTIGTAGGIAIMMNNYFHDVATALLAASAFSLWAIARIHGRHTGLEADRFFLEAYGHLKGLVLFALAWIVVGGVPRTIFYKDFEWANAAGKGQVAALVVKHILAFLFLGLGVFGWAKLGRRVSGARARLDESRP